MGPCEHAGGRNILYFLFFLSGELPVSSGRARARALATRSEPARRSLHATTTQRAREGGGGAGSILVGREWGPSVFVAALFWVPGEGGGRARARALMSSGGGVSRRKSLGGWTLQRAGRPDSCASRPGAITARSPALKKGQTRCSLRASTCALRASIVSKNTSTQALHLLL